LTHFVTRALPPRSFLEDKERMATNAHTLLTTARTLSDAPTAAGDHRGELMRTKLRTSVTCSVVAVILGLACAANVSATQAGKIGPIQEAHFYSHVRVDNPNTVWLKLPGTWPGTTCAADWGWFNAKEEPAMVAAVLVARTTGATVSVYVDDSYPKIYGYCHVTLIASI
jgi:hypothetical protein